MISNTTHIEDIATPMVRTTRPSQWSPDLLTPSEARCSYSRRRRQLTVAGHQLLYTNNYFELWRSDGTSTSLASKRNTFCGGLRTLTAVGERLFFSGFPCAGSKGRELWTSDGTAAGTTLVKDINPRVGTGSIPTDMARVGARLYFTASDGVHGRELWRSNGTNAGTRLVKDIKPGGKRSDSSPTEPTRAGSITFFAAADGVHGRELWRTDGTVAGTRRVRDIRPGGRGSAPEDLTNVGGVLLFTASDGVHGRELWRSDGTRAGTRRVADIRPGAYGSDPQITHSGRTQALLHRGRRCPRSRPLDQSRHPCKHQSRQ